MGELEHIRPGVGVLNVRCGDVVKRSEEVSGDRDLDTLHREILIITQIPDGYKRVIAEVSIGIRYPQGNRFSIPETQLTPKYFMKLEIGG